MSQSSPSNSAERMWSRDARREIEANRKAERLADNFPQIEARPLDSGKCCCYSRRLWWESARARSYMKASDNRQAFSIDTAVPCGVYCSLEVEYRLLVLIYSFYDFIKSK